MSHRPPRVAERVLRAILAEPDRDFILGDLAEQYRSSVVPRHGRIGGWLWYWNQVRQSIGPSRRRRRAVRVAWARSRRKSPHILSREPLMESLRQDVVFAVRQLRRSRGFALTVILTLALGIGDRKSVV